jgi:hypothetical protein
MTPSDVEKTLNDAFASPSDAKLLKAVQLMLTSALDKKAELLIMCVLDEKFYAVPINLDPNEAKNMLVKLVEMIDTADSMTDDRTLN